MEKLFRTTRFLLILCLLAAILTACGTNTTSTSTGTETTPTSLISSPPAFTPTPESTPTSAPNTILLVAGDAADATQVAALKATLTSLVGADHLELLTKSSLTSADLGSSTRIVVALPPDPGLADLAKASPGIQFVAVGIENLQAAANLSLIGAQGFHPDQQAFLAGYLSALLTEDWRVGILTLAGNTNAGVEENAFTNGARYFCGLCRPAHPPFLDYPQVEEISSTSDQTGWQTQADNLIKNGVMAVYISPEAASPGLMAYLAGSQVNLIGNQSPPDAVRSQWIATILPDPGSALSQVWPDLLAGKGGAQVALPIKLTDVNTTLLDQARQRLVDATLAGLVDGYIEPNPIPAS